MRPNIAKYHVNLGGPPKSYELIKIMVYMLCRRHLPHAKEIQIG